MKVYDVAFYVAGFFILGVLVASLNLDFLTTVMATILMAALFLFIGYLKNLPSLEAERARYGVKFFWLAGLVFSIIIGAFYYVWWSGNQIKNVNLVFDKKINFSGTIVDYPERGNQQKLVVNLRQPYSGKILVKISAYPGFNYGDLIKFEGVIKKPEPEDYADYLAKDGIFGTAEFLKIELLAQNQGSSVKSLLFRLRGKIVAVFQKTLASEKAAFLSGITLGERAEFSKDFKNALSKSGTTHLVALSGYNISVIVVAMFVLFNRFLSRRLTFILTVFVILGFVLMSGAEASVVRAAIMGFIVLLAKEMGRLYSSRNAIILAAFLMVIFNPKILSFDLGFQLSFMALLGIVYLSPAIQNFFRLNQESGFLSWRENFLTTCSAQLAVVPILIMSFGVFSPLSLLANLLILVLIPLTMSLGFILAALGFISYYLSLVFGWFVNLFLSYELFVIKFFGQLDFLQINHLSGFLAVIYYVTLITFIFYVFWRRRDLKINQQL